MISIGAEVFKVMGVGGHYTVPTKNITGYTWGHGYESAGKTQLLCLLSPLPQCVITAIRKHNQSLE